MYRLSLKAICAALCCGLLMTRDIARVQLHGHQPEGAAEPGSRFTTGKTICLEALKMVSGWALLTLTAKSIGRVRACSFRHSSSATPSSFT